jgi:hypothetical protein
LWLMEVSVVAGGVVAGEPLLGASLLALHILVYRIPFTRMWTNWTTTSGPLVWTYFYQ